MKRNNRIINSVIKKAKLFDPKTNTWCAYLTPSDTLTLIELNVIKPSKSNEYLVDRFKEYKQNGICNPTWFYFHPVNKTIFKQKEII